MAGNTQSSLEQPPPPLPQKDKGGATDKREITFSPHECSVQGGGHITITFPKGVPGGRILVTLKGTVLEHILTADKVDENTVSIPLPAHENAEVVSLKIFHVADPEKEDDKVILIDDTFVYTDPTGYMAELLIQSVTDTQAVPLLYSVLPPLATYRSDELSLFDASLTAAVKREKLPEHWNVLGRKKDGQRTGCSSTGDTLLHFAAYSQLPQLFAYLLSLPGGKEAVKIANHNNQLPLHLAQQNGCKQIVALIEKLDPVESPKLSNAPFSPFIVDSPSEHLRWLRSIDSDWISQRNSSLTTTAIPPVPSLAPPPPDHPKRRKSASVMEELRGSAAATCLFDVARKRNWSRVVGSGNSRSIDTGLNELHRISELMLYENNLSEMGLPRPLVSSSRSSSTTRISSGRNSDSALTPIVRRTSSCPVQLDNLSPQLIHSIVTSPGLIGRFSASPSSINGDNETSPQTSPTLPHTAIVTSTSNSESVSPLTVPSLCMEDTETSERFCVPVGLTVPKNERPYSARESHKSESAADGMIKDTEEDAENAGGDSPILASISAPDLLVVTSDSEDKDSPPLLPKKVAVPDVVEISVPPQRKASPQLSSKSFSGKDQPMRAKRHKKSFSVSGVKVFMDDGSGLGREDERIQGAASALSVSPGEAENRSRGSSLLSTSSKTGSSISDMGMEDDEEDDEVIRVLSPPGKLAAGKPSPLGEKKLSAVVTNIDDYSASSEDEDRLRTTYWEKQPDSDITPTNTLSFSTHSPGTRGRRANWKQPVDDIDAGKAADENAEVNLSDIDVRMDSLNNSQSTAQLEQGLAQVSNGVPPGTPPLQHLRRESCPSPSGVMPYHHPKLTPTSSSERTPPSARSTIGQLKKLMMEEEGANATNLSDESDREGTPKLARKKKVQTLPSGRATPPPKLSRNQGSLTLNKVSRNSSSASDSVIFAPQNSREVDITSLDFQQSPNDPSSPCESPRAQRSNLPDHPPSPLSLPKPRSNSPLLRSGEEIKIPEISPLKNAVKASLSPLEKHVSRSADNLLLEDHDKEPGRVLISEDGERTVKHLRFKEDDHVIVGKRNKGDKSSEKEPSRFVKLFRRDSKRTGKMSKNDSSTSLDAYPTDDDPAKKYELARAKANKTRPPPIQDAFTPPLVSPGRKPRSATIHGDCNLPHSVSLDFEQPMISLQPMRSVPHDSSTPISPISKTEPEIVEPEATPIVVSVEDHPELEMSMNEEKTWYQTIDRRLRKSMSKHEKARQGAIYDLVRTERHYLRSLTVMKLIFRDAVKSEFNEEVVENLFPYLDQLVVISREFSDRLVSRQQNSTNVISDISDILFDQFTEEKGKELFTVYSGFVCLQPAAVEYYKELLKKKPRFVRLMNGLYTNKHCERRKLPDFYLLITQRVAKYVEIMKRIVKETEALGLDHLPRLKQSSKALADLVEAVDVAVYDYTNRKELEDIQSRLEVSVSSHTRKGSWSRKELKRLDLLAQDRKLVKKGEAVWQGHGKQLNVHVVLVTDCLVLLTEKDQKLNIASLLDSKYPVIKLYDLHVRVNASVKSGIQLLLLEQGDHPEMFRLEFITKKMAKEWEEALNKAVEHCRKNNITCDCLSADILMSGDDEVKGEEDEIDGDVIEPLRTDLSPTTLRRMQIQESVDLATRFLTTEDPVAVHRHSVASSSASSTPNQKSNRPARSATLYEQRRGNEVPELKKRLSKKAPERNKTMKEKERVAAVSHDNWDRERQAMLDCISKLKDSIDYLTEQNDRKDKQIEKLKQDVSEMKQERRQASDSDSSPVMTRNTSSHAPFGRPHSVHYDLLDNPPDFSHLSPASARKRSKLTVVVPPQNS